MKRLLFLILITAAAVFFLGWPKTAPNSPRLRSNNRSTAPFDEFSPQLSSEASGKRLSVAGEPCALVARPHSGETPLDRDIQFCQRDLLASRQPELVLEKLGWLYVEKARRAFDPRFYTLAEQCADCLEAKASQNPAAKLLRGQVWQSLHRFREAEPLARSLVTQRGLPFDFGLLGDLLMEQGKLQEAVDAYQSMVNLKPDPHAYVRIAHLRWLRGDLDGAVEVSRMAASAVGAGKSEAAAWIQTRRAFYEWQAGGTRRAEAPRGEDGRSGAEALPGEGAAEACCQWVLQSNPDYAPAHLLLGRIQLAEEMYEAAADSLQRAAALNPLPEYLWALIEALEMTGKSAQARELEANLARSGPATDPRTYSLYLATRRREPETALELAQRERKERADVHTHDALAWALAGAGRWTDAYAESVHALAEGTADPRLYLHAGLIARRVGKSDEAQSRLSQAAASRHILLPTEQRLLDNGLVGVRTAAAETN